MSKLRFCPKCQNNFSNYNIDETDKGEPIFQYTCSSCLYRESIPIGDIKEHALLYSKTTLNRRPDRELHWDMCQDPTLAHTSTVPCPNPKCPSKSNNDNNVVFLEYNEDKKLAFICCHSECKEIWTT
jgi:hypothetical protein